MNARLKARIRELPGDDGWWKRSGEDDVRKIAQEMLDVGVAEDQVVDWLARMYTVIAEEFGN